MDVSRSSHSASVESGVNCSNSRSEGFSLLVLASDLVVDADTFSSPGVNHSHDSAASRIVDGDTDDFADLEQLQILRVEGCDKGGRRILRIVGKFYPARVVDAGRLKRYTHMILLNKLKEEPFVIVYFHTQVQRGENSPGMFALRQIYEGLPEQAKQRLHSVYFIHPGLRSRLILATLGRYFLSEGLYWKITYVSRIEFLWDHIKQGEVEVPEFVYEHDNDLESSPLLDYGLVTDPMQALDTNTSRGSASGRYSSRYII